MDDLRTELRRLLKPRSIPLQEIRPTLAFDAIPWLNSLGASDPYMRLLGGFPPTLESRIRDFITRLKDFGPKPIFFFDGLPLIQESNEHSLQKRQKALKDMWTSLSSGAVTNMPRAQTYNEDYAPEIIALMKSCGAECFRAPYKSAMQLAYLSTNSHVGAVYGDYDLLMYDAKKIVVEIDLERGVALCFDSSAAIAELGLQADRVFELFVLKGYCNVKELVREESRKLIENLRLRDGFSFLPTADSQAVKVFEVTRNYLKSQIITKPDKPETTPMHLQFKLETAIGLRFNHEVYFAATVTPLSFQLLSAITSRKVVELPPIADSKYYHVALSKIMRTRTCCYNLLLSFLNEAFRKNEIVVQYWFGETQSIPYEEMQPLKWVFTRSEVEQQITFQSRQMDFVFCLKWHYDAYLENSPLVANLKSEDAVELPADSHKDVLCRVFFKFLEMCNFIGPNGEPMVFGKALMKHAGEFQHELFIVLEMLGMGLLNGRTMQQADFLPKEVFRTLTRSEEGISDEDRHSAMLAARVCSLVQPKLAASAWTGPMSYPIAQFYSITRLLQRNYRLLLEAIIIKEFCSKRFSSPELFRGLAEKLPFRAVPCSALGMVMRSLLLGKSLEAIQATYPECIDIPGDLEKCWKFWKVVFAAVTCLHKHLSLKDKAYQEYVHAHSLFRSKLEAALPDRTWD